MRDIPLPSLPEVPVTVPTSHNVTLSKDPEYLVYNRVPKCGSNSIMKVLMDLREANEFVLWAITQNHALDGKETRGLSEQIKTIQSMSMEGKVVFSSHFYYVDFKQFEFNPIMVNVVRDPVQRMISKEIPI